MLTARAIYVWDGHGGGVRNFGSKGRITSAKLRLVCRKSSRFSISNINYTCKTFGNTINPKP